MLSYRHSYHAGNHGDVLKHLSQMLVINKLKEKDKPFTYFDTHSGAGVYNLDAEEALKTNEFRMGISRLENQSVSNHGINHYITLINAYKEHNQYPGSPEIAKTMLRAHDKAVLMEWHNQEVQNLRSNLGGNHISIHHRDGYEGLIALTPPQTARGLVLIDPSYELAEDYQQVADTVIKVYKKWPTAIFMIWYPLLSKRNNPNDGFTSSLSKKGKSQKMIEQLSKQSFKNMLTAELCVTGEEESEGMFGSGMAIINAPWQLDVKLSDSLEQLTPILAQTHDASYSVDWLICE